jgi:predicted transcriptional regulator
VPEGSMMNRARRGTKSAKIGIFISPRHPSDHRGVFTHAKWVKSVSGSA